MTLSTMTRLPSLQEEAIEEAVGDLYECFEAKRTSAAELEPLIDSKIEAGIFKKCREAGLLTVNNGQVTLTAGGEYVATAVIRRKRLAERLLKDVLNVREEAINPAACQWEHTLSKEVTNSICTLLGHPSHSPQELPIPPGECCKTATRSAAPVITSLSQMKSGGKAKIIYLLMKKYPELNRLLSMGLAPGAELELLQRFPTFVVQVNETQLAFDEMIAEGIFVHPL